MEIAGMEVPVSLNVVPYACIAFSEIYIKVLLNIIKVSCMFYIYPCALFYILLWHGFPETCRDDVDFSFPSYWFWHMWQDIASKYVWALNKVCHFYGGNDHF